MARVLIAHTSLGESWWVTNLSGEEAISSLYSFTVNFESDSVNIDCQALIGQVAAIELEAQKNQTRYFSGRIINVAAMGKVGRHWGYEIMLAPSLWYASRHADFRIWQNLTVQSIADDVLERNGIRYDWRLKGTYKTWEYLVQYGETDLNFLSRLFEHEGIYYWFEHRADGETLILADHFTTHEPCPGYENIPFYPPDEARADEDHYSRWRAARKPVSGQFTFRDYDFKHPLKDLTTEANDPRGHLFDHYEMYDYPGNYVEPDDGSTYARVRLEALQWEQDRIAMEGNVRGAVPGSRFVLRNHPRQDQNREFVVTEAIYDIKNNKYEALRAENGANFNIKIKAIPASIQYRARLETPKPRTRGSETAVVVGPHGREIHTDEYGRVKVHFHWDRYGQKDGQDSCWIRVASSWAGSNFGAIHIPRIGQEVIVDFEHGDPDRPIITGRVYNAKQMPPWDLPANDTQSGILTRSSPNGTPMNANALRFEDAKGQEVIWMHAERDLTGEVERNESLFVGRTRRKTVCKNEFDNIGVHWSIRVGGYKTETIGLTSIQKVIGARLEMVGLGYILNVGVAYNINVGAGYVLNVGAAYNENIGAGHIATIGGVKLTVVGLANLVQVGPNSTLLMGLDQILIKCGASQIALKSDGTIAIAGTMISLTAALITQN
jgi:type VI secretion system secreted protein VgrG